MKYIISLIIGITIAVTAGLLITNQNNILAVTDESVSTAETLGESNEAIAQADGSIDTATAALETSESAPAPSPAATPDAIEAIITGEVATKVVRPTTDSGQREVITLAGGCFWCTEAYLQETPGVVSAISGYAGGEADTATYKQVSKGGTGHREAVQVTFDPIRITAKEVLAVYWSHINPTDAGGQFADRGQHYTTAIYYHSSTQKSVAEASKQALSQSGLFSSPIVTVILPYTTFFAAEEYHQDYYKKASEHYERYKKGSGRAGYVEDNWAKAAALEFLES